MAFRRRRIKDRPIPVKCSFCKEKKANFTIHGGMATGMGLGGKACCDDCFPGIQARVEKAEEWERKQGFSEADYQTWMRL